MVGRYRVEDRLGAGAMGEVYLGVDEGLGRRAALKFLGGHDLSNETQRERFLREARAIAQLSHPNLIVIFEAGEHEGRPYYAMELLEGGDTMQLLAEQRVMRPGVVAAIGAQAAAGLSEAARKGITHRDVKPSNLGIDARGVIKVTDFGLAKSQTREQSLTGKGLVVGTADYIAPEQARGEPLDERADVYSLGCTLYHLLAGRPPYRREDNAMQSYMDVITDHLQAPVRDVREAVPGVDEELADLLTATMAKKPDGRPSLTDLASALQRIATRIGAEIPRLSKRSVSATADVPTELGRRAAVRPVVTRPVVGGVARLSSSDGGDGSGEDSMSEASESLQRAVQKLSPRWPKMLALVLIVAVAAVLAATYVR